MEDLTGRQFGPYRIVAPLGEGGMAAVYRAYQAKVDRYVALKVLPQFFASDPDYVTRFEQEAHLLARLQHPHILPVHDYGTADGFTYIVMPFVQSGTLETLMNGKPLPLERIKMIVSQVGDALDYAHSKGIIHRDVKPSNVLLDSRGNCLLTDFGIAKMIEGTRQITRTGGIIGTPAYMSPEQIEGKRLDGRSDIYSLGVVLYQMATGRPPFQAETPPAVMVKHLHDPLPPPRQFNADIPFRLETVILKSLAKRPEDRYATAGEMVRTVKDINATGPAAVAAATVMVAEDATVRLSEESTSARTSAATAAAATAAATRLQTIGYVGPVTAQQGQATSGYPPAAAQQRQQEKGRSPWLLAGAGCLIVFLLFLVGGSVSALIMGQAGIQPIAGWLGNTSETPTSTPVIANQIQATDEAATTIAEAVAASAEASTAVAAAATAQATAQVTEAPPTSSPSPTRTPSVVPSPTASATLAPSTTAIPASVTPLPPTNTPVPPTFTPLPTFTPSFTPSPPPTFTPTFTPTPEPLTCADPLPAPQIFFSRQETIDGSTRPALLARHSQRRRLPRRAVFSGAGTAGLWQQHQCFTHLGEHLQCEW